MSSVNPIRLILPANSRKDQSFEIYRLTRDILRSDRAFMSYILRKLCACNSGGFLNILIKNEGWIEYNAQKDIITMGQLE